MGRQSYTWLHTTNMQVIVAFSALLAIAAAVPRPDNPPSYAAPAYPDEPAKYAYSWAVKTTTPTTISVRTRTGTDMPPADPTMLPFPTVGSRRCPTASMETEVMLLMSRTKEKP